MKEEVDEEVGVAEEDVGWTTSFLGVLLVEEVVEEVEEVELLVVVGVELVEVVEVVELVVSVSVSSTCTGVGDGEGVGVGVGVGEGEGDTTAALLSSLLLLFELESSELEVSSGVAAAVMYPPTGPSNVLAAVW